MGESAATMQSIFETAINGVKTETFGMMGTAAPVALAIGAAVLGITLGWGFFKKLTHK